MVVCVRVSLSAVEYHNLCTGGCKIGNGNVNRPWCRDRRQFYKRTITGKNTGPIQPNEIALFRGEIMSQALREKQWQD